jgi:hypothetical protein
MRPTQHASSNDVLHAPPGSKVEECRPLYITRVVFSDGVPAVRSYWEPTEAERAAIALGALVFISAIGYTHPPVALGVDGIEP